MRDAFLGLKISYLYVLLVFYILHVAFWATLRANEPLRNSYLISAYSFPICLLFSLSTSFQYLTRFSLGKFQICKFHEASHEPFLTCKVAYLCLSSSLAIQFSTNFVSIRILWLTSEISYLYLFSFFPVSSCRLTFSSKFRESSHEPFPILQFPLFVFFVTHRWYNRKEEERRMRRLVDFEKLSGFGGDV